MINRCMNPLTTITNQISKQTFPIERGKPTDKSAVYAAECTKHKLIYIGQTGDQLNNRFNRLDLILNYQNTSVVMIVTLKKTLKFQFRKSKRFRS